MPVPKYYKFYVPILEAIDDGEIHLNLEIKAKVAVLLGLSEEDLLERLPSNTQSVFDNRLGWAKARLKKAGLLISPRKASYQITDEGKRVFHSGVEITDQYLAENYPAYAEFIRYNRINRDPAENQVIQPELDTPQEVFVHAFETINNQLADDLMSEIMNQSSVFFENLVVDLMKAMGYGEGFVTRATNDNGIDGIMHEDKLGFNLIYIQAKKWGPDKTINRPDIQTFAGAMMGPPRIEKGLFITTAKFSPGAKAFAEAQHIILIDGKKLTELMIEHEVGVSTQKTYSVKRIDSDYFG